MGLNFNIESKKKLDDDVEVKRVALKALPEVDRKDSPEEEAFKTAERKISEGLFNRYGTDIVDAYLKIDEVTINSERGITARCSIYLNQQARIEEAQSLTTLEVKLNEADAVIPEGVAAVNAYIKLKTLEFFAEAVDC